MLGSPKGLCLSACRAKVGLFYLKNDNLSLNWNISWFADEKFVLLVKNYLVY